MQKNICGQRFGFVLYYIVSSILVLDQTTKYLARVELPLHVPIHITSFFNLFLTYNKGVSFSLFSNNSAYGPILLSLLSILVSLGIIYWIKKEQNKAIKLALAFILGGAISNVIDRIYLGQVVDFLDFHAFGYHWPAFNVADSAICLGAFIILTRVFFDKEKEQK